MLKKLSADIAAGWAKLFARADDPPPAVTAGMWIIKAADRVFCFASLGVVLACYILDAIFFASVGGAFWPVFLLVGLVFRSFAVGGGPLLQALRGVKNVRDSRRTVRAIQIACALACLYPPVNFFAASHYQKAAEAAAVTDVASASTTSKEARIQTQRDRLERAKETRDTSIKSAQDAMAIIRDQVVGTSAADNATLQKLQGDISKYVDDYRTVESAVNDAITVIEAEREVVQTEAAGKEATTFHTWPVFIWLGDHIPVTDKGPDGKHLPGSDLFWANWSLFGFAMLVEFCAFFALGAYFRVHNVFMTLLKQMASDADPGTTAAATSAPPPAPPLPPADLPVAPATPPPLQPPEEPALSPQQQAGRKGGRATTHNRNAAADGPTKVPTEDWREREQFEEAA